MGLSTSLNPRGLAVKIERTRNSSQAAAEKTAPDRVAGGVSQMSAAAVSCWSSGLAAAG
jgi:hypothetical protein